MMRVHLRERITLVEIRPMTRHPRMNPMEVHMSRVPASFRDRRSASIR